MFFCARSGGVKRYLLAKHEWLTRQLPSVRHTLLVPKSAGVAAGVVPCAARALPLVDGYRFPLSRARWREALLELQPDLIEAGDPYVPGWAAADAAQRLGVPAVAFSHSDVQRMLAERVGDWVKPVARKYLRRFYSRFDVVFAPSRSMVEALAAAGIERVQHQPLGVDTELFHPRRRRTDLKHELGLKESTRLLVYAGRFAQEKNLPVLMETVEKLGESYHLLLIGGRRREAHGRKATFWPYQRSPEMLAGLIGGCDAFVHAGEHETFGLVLAEAMACGVPVVAVDSGGVPEVVSSREGVLVPRADADTLAQGVEALFERDRVALSVAARDRAEKYFSWQAAFMLLASTYFGLTGRQRAPAPVNAHVPA